MFHGKLVVHGGFPVFPFREFSGVSVLPARVLPRALRNIVETSVVNFSAIKCNHANL